MNRIITIWALMIFLIIVTGCGSAEGQPPVQVETDIVLTRTPVATLTSKPEAEGRVEEGPEGDAENPEKALETSEIAAEDTGIVYTKDDNPCIRLTPFGRGGGGGQNPIAIQQVNDAVIMRLEGHERPVYFAGFSYDGRFMVTSDFQETRIWNAADGELIKTIPKQDSYTLDAISSNSPYLAVNAAEGRMDIWNLDDLDKRPVLLQIGDYVGTMTLSPDGRYLVTAINNVAKLWDIASGEVKTTFEGQVLSERTVAEGGYEISEIGNGHISIWLLLMICWFVPEKLLLIKSVGHYSEKAVNIG